MKTVTLWLLLPVWLVTGYVLSLVLLGALPICLWMGWSTFEGACGYGEAFFVAPCLALAFAVFVQRWCLKRQKN
jgi:hypothetical protein